MKTKSTPENLIRLFGMTNLQLFSELKQLEKNLSLNMGMTAPENDSSDQTYYPQFPEAVRIEAAQMSKYYEVFYCLEKFARQMIQQKLESAKGADWWNECIPQQIKTTATQARQREVDSGVTPRSDELLDFTTFGELADIINSNWTTFGDVFSSQKAVQRVMGNLNTLRGPIAHCSILAEDEVIRLQMSVRDWFRLME